MAAAMPQTYQEQLMKLLQMLAAAKAAPDANLDELSTLEKQVLSSIRRPMDTPVANSPVGSAMDLSNGASAPEAGAPTPGQLSPMLQALLMGPQGGGGAPGAPGAAPPAGPPPAAAGSFPTHGLMASPAPPNMDEVRRMLTVAGNR